MDTVRGAVLANDGSIDIAAGLSNIMPELAQDGMFFNLLAPDMPYFDFDSPWWPVRAGGRAFGAGKTVYDLGRGLPWNDQGAHVLLFPTRIWWRTSA